MRQAVILATAIGATLLAPHANAQSQRLIDEGRRLFFEETFDGNGRTCGTCHPATNNFTIDPEFISQLPDNDPLFVDVDGLEDPDLLLQGLILENVDGMGEVIPPVFRGVPHTLGLRASTEPDDDGDEDQAEGGVMPVHALGWSADGAPDSGSLRDFAKGAVIQHFPKTIARVAGEDFRLPTDFELDALEAFQMSLGRDADPAIDAMTFADEAATRGRDLFTAKDNPDARACTACHDNAGANTPDGGNDNFDTGTRKLGLVDNPDGGFGRKHEDGIPGFGNGTMNTPSLIEAADTAPYFHNNTAATLEEAIKFYTTETFATSPTGDLLGGKFDLTDADIADVAAFLSALNAIDNARNAFAVANDARRMRHDEDAAEILMAVASDIRDGITVLNRSDLAPDAVEEFEAALALAEAAMEASNRGQMNSAISELQRTLRGIPELIAVENVGVASGR